MTIQANVRFASEVFLVQAQRETLAHISGPLQQILEEYYLASDLAGDAEIAGIVLDIVKRDERFCTPPGELVLTTVLKSTLIDLKTPLVKVLALMDAGLADLLFQCATSSKHRFYSPDVVVKMIDLLYQLITYLPNPLPLFAPFPPFDEKGEKTLLHILGNPRKLIHVLFENTAPSSSTATESLAVLRLQVADCDFSEMKSLVVKYLGSLDKTQRLPIESYLALIKNVQRLDTLHIRTKNALLVLFVQVTTNNKTSSAKRDTPQDLQQLVDAMVALHMRLGSDFLYDFCKVPQTQQITSLHDMISHCNASIESGAVYPQTAISNPCSSPAVELDDFFCRLSGKKSDPNVHFPLSQTIFEKTRQAYARVVQCCYEWKFLSVTELVNKALEISLISSHDLDSALQLVALGSLVIKHEFKIELYESQICTVIAQLIHTQGVVAQVKTGEGKSKIAALLALVLSLKHKKQGHIISSAHELSIRDQEEHAAFFALFGITTSHICGHDRDGRYFQSQILYGTPADFEFAVMREMLHLEKLFPDTADTKIQGRFGWVIVDEIDNLTIDTSIHGARLSLEAENTYDWLYLPIFTYVQEHTSEFHFDAVKSYLRAYDNGNFAAVVNDVSDARLNRLIASARCALTGRHEKKQYVIRNNQVLIVDASNTGRIQHGSRWTGGIHEFIELKHDLDIRHQGICPISMSHPVFYQMYASLYGLTGTIGSQYERQELYEIYQLDSFDVPTHFPSQRQDNAVTVCDTDNEYFEKIVRVIQECRQATRPILVLCETIEDTEHIGRILKKSEISFELLNEIQESSEKSIIQKAGLACSVVVAT